MENLGVTLGKSTFLYWQAWILSIGMPRRKTVVPSRETRYLKSHEMGRLATASSDGVPHVVPVIYAMDEACPVIAVDYGTKKLKNLKENNNVAFLVDDYNPNRGLLLQGRGLVLERGREYRRLLKILFAKFDYYRKNPWKEGESPIVKVVPERIASWGIPNVKENPSR